ncbi:response regulator transcription factor [Moheibacter stercoris]|uniref:DNA-binding NarL/FixJ family response regulator n=1 Tax=Moheibacter stercoris TaxID=1628251 RepID=A0ABV2LUG0_9FLAO
MAIRVLAYDDNDLIRNSVKLLLEVETDIELSGSFSSALSIISDVEYLKPDVILMDVDMPEINGVEAVKLLRTKFDSIPVIMLTVFDDNDTIFNAVCAGATGYILKQHVTEELASALRMVINGGAPMTGSIAKKILFMLPVATTRDQETYNLTEKETEILKCLVKGFSYKMISHEIGISIDTVRFHIKKIYDKLHVHSATEAVSKAIKNRLV